MNNLKNPLGIFSGSTLKIIACVLMLIDHVGEHLFHGVPIFKIIGRLALPIFAFFIAEGCRYTKNKLKYFLLIFGSGILFLVGTYAFSGRWFFNVFLNFSVAIPYVYLMQCFRGIVLRSKRKALSASLLSLAYLSSLFPAYVLFRVLPIEYGFFTFLIPVSISLFDLDRHVSSPFVKYADNIFTRVLVTGVCLLLLSLTSVSRIQIFSLLALPLLLLYNGKVGTKKLKYFFYIFYPAHVAVIYAVKILFFK